MELPVVHGYNVDVMEGRYGAHSVREQREGSSADVLVSSQSEAVKKNVMEDDLSMKEEDL